MNNQKEFYRLVTSSLSNEHNAECRYDVRISRVSRK